MEPRLSKTFTTHMPMLIKAVQMTDGSVLELGGGFFSTPILHWLCAEKRGKLVTYESNPDYMKFLKSFQSRTHFVRMIENWDQLDLKAHWSVIFVDFDPGRKRAEMIMKLKDSADYIVIHDTTGTDNVHGTPIDWSSFKYCRHWTWCQPYTTVVSNFKDVSNL